MRLQVLNSGQSIVTKMLFAIISLASRQPVLDVVKLAKYRADFYGKLMGEITQEAMRGRSEWSIAERELMAAFVAGCNQCEFCAKAHTAVAQRAYGNDKDVRDLLSYIDTGAISEPLKATLSMLGKLTQNRTLDPEDVRVVLAKGASKQQIFDALAVSFAFNVVNRLADSLGFSIPSNEAFEGGAKYLLSHGYR